MPDWFHGHYEEGVPKIYWTLPFISHEAKDLVFSELRVPAMPHGRVRALEIGPGWYPLTSERPFHAVTFVDSSPWFLHALARGAEITGNQKRNDLPVYVHSMTQTGLRRQRKGQPADFSSVEAEALKEIEEKLANVRPIRKARHLSFVLDDARRLGGYARHAFHLGFLPEVLTHVEPNERESMVRNLAGRVTRRVVIVDRPPQAGLRQLEHGQLKMGNEAVDPEPLEKALREEGFRTFRKLFPSMDFGEFGNSHEYFVLVGDRINPPRIRPRVRLSTRGMAAAAELDRLRRERAVSERPRR